MLRLCVSAMNDWRLSKCRSSECRLQRAVTTSVHPYCHSLGTYISHTNPLKRSIIALFGTPYIYCGGTLRYVSCVDSVVLCMILIRPPAKRYLVHLRLKKLLVRAILGARSRVRVYGMQLLGVYCL